ncbi:C40 family peptidase [Mucilaginibacter sp. RS28]|uniref:C40 family peptidase n=1 Tax=Mucilaginibacter straminoryzae TaxID=2932774 RepID=A0A9X1X100_9SPHI|nr:C40 family peptidase [Mucilaginibacter straminoryzae]MCJ8209242.1 C40 family peptidase [Mucilaginibacter straminoryzae]
MRDNRKVFRYNAALICAFLLAFTNVAFGQSDSTAAKKVLQMVNEVRLKFAPDKRTDIFNAQVNNLQPLIVTLETTVPAAAITLQKHLSATDIPLVLRTDTLPAKELQGKIFGVANLSVSNNRISPGNAPEMVTQMLLGTPVTILKTQRGYSLVRTPDRYISWVDNSAITPMDAAAFVAWRDAAKVIYTNQYGHAYQQASRSSLPVSDLVAGDILQFHGKKADFYEVAFPDGRIAYIPVNEAADYQKWLDKPKPDAAKILATAQTLIGVPYLWGGTSIKGVDCSGFTKTAYFLNGIILPRDASQQALVGKEVDIYEADSVSNAKCLKNLQPGDLLFFSPGIRQGRQAKITHTGIYMGNGQFIQSAGMVKINSLDPKAANYDDYRRQRLVVARRMLTSVGEPGIVKVSDHPFYHSTSKK